MEYRSDLKSSLIISALVPIIPLGPAYGMFDIIMGILKFIIVFIIVYFFTKVEYNDNFLIIKIFNHEKKYDLNKYLLDNREKNYFYRIKRSGFWGVTNGYYKVYYPTKKLVFLNNNKVKTVYLFFLSKKDFSEIKDNIFFNQSNKKQNNMHYTNFISIDSSLENEYYIDTKRIKNNIEKICKNRKKYMRFYIILPFSIILILYLCNFVFAQIIIIFFLSISFCLKFILDINSLNIIKHKLIEKIVIKDKLIIDNDIFDYNEIEKIIIYSSIDNIQNELRSLIITTKNGTYTYYLDYLIDDEEVFIHYELLCTNLKKIFNNIYFEKKVVKY